MGGDQRACAGHQRGRSLGHLVGRPGGPVADRIRLTDDEFAARLACFANLTHIEIPDAGTWSTSTSRGAQPADRPVSGKDPIMITFGRLAPACS